MSIFGKLLTVIFSRLRSSLRCALTAVFILACGFAYSASYYWTDNNGNWNDPLNWSLTAGGTGGAGIPGDGDEVWISSNIRLTGDITVRTVYIQGTVNLDLNGYNLNVSSNGSYNYANVNSEYFAGAIHLGRNGTAGNLSVSGSGNINVEIFDEEEAALNSLSIGENATVTVSGHMWTDANTAAYGVNLSGTGKFVMAAGSHIASGSGGYYGFKIDSGVQVVDPDNLLSLCEWMGGTDSDWNKGSNWRYKHVPKTGDDVIILNVANKPVISGAAVSIGKLTVNAGATVSFAESLTITGFEGTGTLINTNTTSTQKKLVVNSTSDVTIPYVESRPGTQNIAVENRNHSTVLTINSFMSNNDVELNLYGNINFSTSAIVKSFYVSDGTVTVDSSITVTGDLTTSGTGGNLVLSGSSAPVTIGGNLLNYYSIDLNGNDVKFTGTSPVVEGNVDFGNLDATACTNLTFNGKVKVAGNFVSASTKTVFKSDADFSSATGYTARGYTDFFNTVAGSSAHVFKTFDGMDLGTFYFAGNTEVVINGNVTAYQYRIPDNAHGYDMTQTFEAVTLSGSGSPKLTITNFFDIGRSSASAAVTGKCIIDCDVDYVSGTSGQVHVGANLIIKAGKTFNASPERIVGTSGTANPHPLIEVYGTLITGKVLDLAQNDNNPSCSRLIVYSGGKVSAQKIAWNSTRKNYFDTAVPLEIKAGGEIEVAYGIEVIQNSNGGTELECINNGTIRVTGAGGTVSASYFSGNGTIEALDSVTIESASATRTSAQNEIICKDSATVKGKWSLTDFTASGLGGKTISLDGSTVAVSGNLTLSGSSDSSLLNIAGTNATDGFVLSADQKDNGRYLSVDSVVKVLDGAGVAGSYKYEAKDSVPAAGPSDSDYADLVENGWILKDPKLFTYVWTGDKSSDWSNYLNWQPKMCPVEDATVQIPAVTVFPEIPASGTFETGNLTVAAGAKITLKAQNLVLSGMAGDAAASDTLVNDGTIVYTGDGRITDGSSIINDILNGGTVEYAKSTPAAAGVISDISYANLVISGNTWTTENTTVSATGNVTVSGGTVTFDGDDGLEADGSFTLSGGTFSGKIKAASIAVTGAAVANGDFTFVSDDITVSRGITATNYTATLYPASDDKPVVFGIGVAGALSLTNTELGYLGAKTVILGSSTNTAGLTINQSMSVNSGIHLITGGTMSQTAGGTYTINSIRGELYLEANDGIGDITGDAPVTIGSVSDTVSAKITGAGDIFLKIANTGTTTLGGEGSKVILAPNGNIKIETAGNMILGGNIEATSGTLGLASGGTLTRTGGVLTSNDKITLSARGVIGSSVSPVEIDCDSVSAGTTSGGIYLSQDGTMKVSGAGDISVAAASVFLKADDFDFVPGAVAAGSGTVTLTSHDAEDSGLEINQTKLNGITSATARKLVLGDGSQTGGITVSGSVNLGSFTDTTFSSKVFNSSSAVISAGKVILSPVENEITLNGGFTFYDLEAKTMGVKTIKFGAGSTTKITNSLTLWGTSASSRLTLRSTADDSQWTVNCTCPSANTDIRWVDVKDSNNISSNGGSDYDLIAGPAATPASSIDSGNNDNWSFPGQPYTWKGGASGDEKGWAVKANWVQNSVPSKGGYVTIPAGRDYYPLLTADISLGTGTLTVAGTSADSRGEIDLADYGFTAARITNNGLVRMSGNGNVITAGLVNGTTSTVEYYGDCGSVSLPWGKSYSNLHFSNGAVVSLPADYALTVSGITYLDNGTGNSISLSGANTFTGGVKIISAGELILNSSGQLVIADMDSTDVCDSLEVLSASKIQNINSVNGQIYTGAVTLAGNSVLTGGTDKTVWFKSTVGGGITNGTEYSLHIKNADLQLDGIAGVAGRLKSVEVDGKAVINSTGITVRTAAADGGAVIFHDKVTLGNSLTVTANGADVSFEKDITGTGNNLTVTGGNQTTFSADVNAAALSVTGKTAFNKTSAQTVTTSGNQTYSGDVTFVNDLTLDTAGTVTFTGNVTGPADLTVNGTVTAETAGKSFDLRDIVNSEYKLLTLGNGFTSGKRANFVLYGNAVIHGSNDFALLKINNNEYEKATSVTFDKDSVQTIRNPVSASEVYFSGNSESYPLTITGGSSGEHWNTVFVNKPAAVNFKYVIIENSHSVTSGALANDLKIVPSIDHVQDSDNSAYTTSYWFAYDFYWWGKTDKNWTEKSNWSYSADSYSAALGYPDYQNGTSDIYIVENDSNELILDRAIDVNSVTVNAGTIIDFATYDVTLRKAIDSLVNDGYVRLSGSQSVSAVLKNGTDSTVEYYGPCGTALQLGNEYDNLKFTTGSSATVSSDITINGTVLFASGTGNDISLTGANSFSGALTLGNDDDQAGNVALSGNNTFGSSAKITINSADEVVLKGTGIVINSGAECDSLNVKSAVTLGNVTTSSVISGASDNATQIYEGNVILSEASSFTGTTGQLVRFDSDVDCKTFDLTSVTADIKVSGNITNGGIITAGAGANAEFCGNITASSVVITGTAAYSAPSQTVTTTGIQTYRDDVTVEGAVTINSAGDVTFDKAIDSEAAGNGSLTAEISGAKLLVTGKIGGTTALNSLTASAEDIEFNGYETSGAVTLTADSGAIIFNSDDYVSANAEQKIISAHGVKFLAKDDGNWSAGTASIVLNDTDLFMDASGKTVTLGSDLSARNVYFYNGTIATAKKISAVKDIAVFGSSYSAVDTSYSADNKRFAYWHDELDYYPGTSSFASNIVTFILAPSAAFTFTSGAKLTAGENFYVNGTDLSTVTVSVPDNSASNPVFNSTGNVTKDQWGLPYAVVFNSAVNNVTADNGWIAAASEGQGCTASGTNVKVQFDIPHIEKAYTVYDDVIFVKFDKKVENSNGEVKQNINTLDSSALNEGGIWYNGKALRIDEGVYADAECTTLVSETEDLDSFYIRTANELWNTDATGLASANASSTDINDSTDRNGHHHSVTVDLSFLEGLFTAADGHTFARNYGINKLANGSTAPSYTDTEDHTSPVLIAVYTGQELHTVSASQPEYDAHNFIEFRYSEAVDIGDMTYNGGDSNKRAENTFSAHGGHIPNSASGLTVTGFASLETGKLDAGVKTGSDSPHALYRTFSTTAGGTDVAQTHKIRIAVAGYVDGKNSEGTYHNYIGFINSAETPAGNVTRIANAGIKDIASSTDDSGNPLVNSLDSVTDTANHELPQLAVNGYSDANAELYGEWDVMGPMISPFSTGLSDWSDWGNGIDTEYHEIIGSSTGGSSLENIELHLLDNNRKQTSKWTQWWRTKRGWLSGEVVTSGLPDVNGGARPFNGANATSGGIRRSSLDGNTSFTYKSITDDVESEEKTIGASYIAQYGIRSNIFRGASDPATQNDGLYLSLPLNAADSYLAIRSTFELYYNPENDYITDLAGNRMAANYSGKTEFSSIDLTPPAYSMTLSPVAENKIYVIFTKQLAYRYSLSGSDDYETEYLTSLNGALKNRALQEIKDSFVVCNEGASASTNEILDVELVKDSKEYTAFLFTLENPVTLNDIETMWLRNIGYGSETVEDLSGFTVSNTKIQDYAGNFLAQNKAHALSDFAVNAAKVIYAYGHEKNEDGWDEQGIYGNKVASDAGDYAVHDFSETQGNYGRISRGRDITLQVQLVSGVDSDGKFIPAGESFTLIPGKKAALTPSMVSDKINKLTQSKWRLWLPTELTSLATSANTNILASPAAPVAAGDDEGLLWNYEFLDADYSFASNDEIQFMFRIDGRTIDHDADAGTASPTPRVPLYAVTMPESRIRAGDFSFIDLWSFGIKDIKQQRGGVSILNNVINVSVKEQTVLEVVTPEAGNLNIYVLTADGNIVKTLSKGQVNAGTHYFKWDGTNIKGNAVARGIYFIRVVGQNIDETRKVMCVK